MEMSGRKVTVMFVEPPGGRNPPAQLLLNPYGHPTPLIVREFGPALEIVSERLALLPAETAPKFKPPFPAIWQRTFCGRFVTVEAVRKPEDKKTPFVSYRE